MAYTLALAALFLLFCDPVFAGKDVALVYEKGPHSTALATVRDEFGNTYRTGELRDSYYVAKYDSGEKELWRDTRLVEEIPASVEESSRGIYRYSFGVRSAYGTALLLDHEGSIYVAGVLQNRQTCQDIFLKKIDVRNGRSLWKEYFVSGNAEEPKGMNLAVDGSILLEAKLSRVEIEEVSRNKHTCAMRGSPSDLWLYFEPDTGELVENPTLPFPDCDQAYSFNARYGR